MSARLHIACNIHLQLHLLDVATATSTIVDEAVNENIRVQVKCFIQHPEIMLLTSAFLYLLVFHLLCRTGHFIAFPF